MATEVVTVAVLERRLNELTGYLTKYMAFINCHMVQFLTENLWMRHIPEDIQEEIRSEEDVRDAIEMFWKYGLHAQNKSLDCETVRYKRFAGFLKETQQHTLDACEDVWVTPEQLKSCFMVEAKMNHLRVTDFMSQKKSHEVSHPAFVMCGSKTNIDFRSK